MKKQYENNIRKGGIAEEIAILKQRREARKAKEEKKNSIQFSGQQKKEQDQKFLKMIAKKKELIYKNNKPLSHIDVSNSKIFVVVRKRPIFQKEINNGEIDCISIINPRVYIHECKIQIDGITKYLEDHEFYFDGTFGENDNTLDIYNITLSPMINLILHQGIVTCFAYGQTGSGKTYTMKGLEKEAIDDLYTASEKMGGIFDFYISFFEIYRGVLYDLLNNKNRVEILDDKNGKVHIYGLYNQIADSPEMMHHIIDSANAIRTTHNTVTNETSSRSHAICNIVVKLKGSDEEYGKLSLVDLAGSERAQETQSNDKERRAEGAEINKSLLALKECIRALDEKKTNPDQHVPFRASKLTHVLRDSFISKSDKSRIIMISCVTPSYTCCNHSLNTLRYSDRLKEKTKQHFGGNYNNINIKARSVNSNPVGNNNLKNSSNNNVNLVKSVNNNINMGNNNLKNNYNTNIPASNNRNYQKSFTKENISQTNKNSSSNKKNNNNSNKISNFNKNNNSNSNKINDSSNKSNNNFGNNSNNKNTKKENNKKENIYNKKNSNITADKLMNELKKSNNANYKKSDIPKNRNSIKYEDKFCMMKEDDIDLEKRNKYSYMYNNDNFNNNANNNNSNNNNINLNKDNNEDTDKNYKNEEDDEKDWDYVQKQDEKDNENDNQNEIIEKYYNNDEEEEENNNIEEEEVINDEEENENENKEQNEEDYIENENDDDDNQNEEDNDDGDVDGDGDGDEELNKIGEDIINTHMTYIREAANILSEEGDLVTNIKGVGKEKSFTLDEYISGLEKIVDKKLNMYGDIKGKIKKYKKIAKKKNGKNY